MSDAIRSESEFPDTLGELVCQDGDSAGKARPLLERHANVSRAMAQLSKDMQIVLRLRYWEELSFEEIGKALGKSTDVACRMWSHAIEQFSRFADELEIG